MSGEAPLVMPIKGYYITVTDHNNDTGEVLFESELRMNKAGGAHITNAEDLIMIIEDAVFTQEKENDSR